MSESKIRDEFEASPRFKGMDFSRSATHPDYYESPYANGAWDGWQASREALVIELLPHVTAEECAAHLEIDDDIALDVSYMINGALIACGGMIKAAGLKVKL